MQPTASPHRGQRHRLIPAVVALLMLVPLLAAQSERAAAQPASSFQGVVDEDGTAQAMHEIEVTDVPIIISASLTWDDADGAANLYLSDPAGTPVAATPDGTVSPAPLRYEAKVPGTYRFDVTVAAGVVDYTLDTALEMVDDAPYNMGVRDERVYDVPQGPGAEGREFNGDRTTAVYTQAVPSEEETFTGFVDANGDHRNPHEFSVTGAPTTIDVTLDWDEQTANLNVVLKNPDGQIVATAAWIDKPERINYEATDNGIWRLEVRAFEGAANYTMAVQQFHDADQPPAEEGEFTGFVDFDGVRRGRHDFVVTDTPVSIEASLTWDNPNANLSLFLKDPDGTTVATSATRHMPERIVFETAQPGTWTIDVRSKEGAANYTVTLSQTVLTPPPGGTSYSFSGNVDANGIRRSPHEFPIDTVPSDIVASLDWVNTAADLSLFLKNPAGDIVAMSAWTSKPEVIAHTATTPGTWRLEVKAVTGATDYSLSVNVNGGGSSGGGAPDGAFDWTSFHADDANTGVSPESTISAANAAGLGIQWQANTGSAAYSSPAVVYNETLDKRLAYVGNQTGTVAAYDVVTGDREWWFRATASVNSSPAVVDGVVYFGSSDYNVYALDAATGNLICSFYTGGTMSSSPLVVDPDGNGKLIIIGDNGLTGGDDGGALWALHAVDPNPAEDCSVAWQFTDYGDPPGSDQVAGTWSPIGVGYDPNGRAILVFGGSSPDNSVYGVEAATGNLLWRYHNDNELFHPDNDFGAGATFSAPGEYGFANGAAFIPGKNKFVYAFDLVTGANLWKFSIRGDFPEGNGATRATPTLHDGRLYVGFDAGLYALDAATGAKIWRSDEANGFPTGEIVSSAALTGPAGSEVLFAGDFWGNIYAFSAATGQILWSYETGFNYASPAVSAGRVYMPSGDGFLYAFGLGGGIGEKPETTLDSPVGGDVDNPDGDLPLSGTYSDDVGVDRVLVAVKDKNRNNWWDPANNRWTKVFTQYEATLSNGTWTSSFPVPFEGGVYYAQAESVDTDGQHDPTVANVDFVIASLGDPPDTTIDTPTQAQVFHFPNGERQVFDITVRGTATDSGGANPGINRINIVIKNIEHGEHYCGSAQCAAGGDGESTAWSPSYTVLQATLDDPGAVTTGWEFTFPTYDHPHKYRLVAWAVDRDGEVDTTKAVVGRICVRDVGDNACV